MNQQPVNISRYAFRYGLLIAAACIVYFLLMRLLHLHTMVTLSLLNAIFVSAGIFFAIRSYKAAKRGMINYLEGLGLGFVTGLIAGAVFSAFIILFSSFIDTQFLDDTTADEYFGSDVSRMALFGYIALEIWMSGALAAFVFMQYFKRPDHKLTA